MAGVVLRNVDKFYGDVHVVRGLDLEVADGEFLVLVGASGCGKSTTLRMVAGLETISSGALEIDGRVVNELSPRDRDIAMVFQSYALYPHVTVYENMAFGLRLRKMAQTEIDRRVGDAAQLLGLQELLQRRPAALSGGQRQRVAMGRAIVREPKVFLFDEPLSNLDAKLRVQMRLEIARLHKRLGTTVLYVTHDQVEAMTLADRIAIMHGGYLQQCDTPQAVYDRPANSYVGTFIGSPAMNLWPVQASAEGGRVRLRGAAIDVVLDGETGAALAGRLASGDAGAWTLGVRPQDLQPVAAERADVVLRVDVVEPLGAETFAYGELDGGAGPAPTERDAATRLRAESPAIVRLEARAPVREGERLALRADRARLHVFDRDGLRVLEADPARQAAVAA